MACHRDRHHYQPLPEPGHRRTPLATAHANQARTQDPKPPLNWENDFARHPRSPSRHKFTRSDVLSGRCSSSFPLHACVYRRERASRCRSYGWGSIGHGGAGEGAGEIVSAMDGPQTPPRPDPWMDTPSRRGGGQHRWLGSRIVERRLIRTGLLLLLGRETHH